MDKQCCQTCFYLDAETVDGDLACSSSGDGDCHRYPPVKRPGNLDVQYPHVCNRDWCGEWKEKV